MKMPKPIASPAEAKQKFASHLSQASKSVKEEVKILLE